MDHGAWLALARVRAINLWLLIVAVPCIAFSVIFGPPNAFWTLVTVVVVIAGILVFVRRAAKVAKQWRAEHDD